MFAKVAAEALMRWGLRMQNIASSDIPVLVPQEQSKSRPRYQMRMAPLVGAILIWSDCTGIFFVLER